MATPVDISTLNFTNGELIDEVLNIRIDLQEWIKSKDSQSKRVPNKLDNETVYLGEKIEELTTLMAQKWDEWINKREEVNIVDSEKINMLRSMRKSEYYTSSPPQEFPPTISSSPLMKFPTIAESSVPCCRCDAFRTSNEVGNTKLRNLTTFEIERAIGDANTRTLLGSGGFGPVYHGKLYGQEIAVKVFNRPKNTSRRKPG